MPDDPNAQKTPEQLAAEAAKKAFLRLNPPSGGIEETPEEKVAREAREAEAAKTKAPVIDAESAKAIGTAVAEGIAAAEAAKVKATPAAPVVEDDIEVIDPAEIDRRIAKGEPIADLIAKFGAGVEERTRRAVRNENGAAVSGMQELTLNQAREQISHFKEYAEEVMKIVERVKPANRTFKVYQDATAMVVGRPDVQKKIIDARVAEELAKATTTKKASAGAAETGSAGRVVATAGSDQQDGELAPTEANLRILVGDDSYNAFMEQKRSRGWTLDNFAQRLGYTDAATWFKRAQELDKISATEGLGLDR